MTEQESDTTTRALKSALKSQYHGALGMLRLAIERCPERLWASDEYCNPFWRVAYHTLHYAHLYVQPNVDTFRPWEHHQTNIQHLDDIPAPPEIEDLIEFPHRPPQTGEPYSKEQILEYLSICEQMVDGTVDSLDLLDPQSGFSWYKLPKMEHQIMSLRHIQHHVGQLADRVRAVADIGVDWVGARRR